MEYKTLLLHHPDAQCGKIKLTIPKNWNVADISDIDFWITRDQQYLGRLKHRAESYQIIGTKENQVYPIWFGLVNN